VNKKYYIIAGEVSGDMHGAALISSMKADRKELEFAGIGGANMINSGLNALLHIKDMAFLGYIKTDGRHWVKRVRIVLM